MGDDISSGSFTREQRKLYRDKVRRCLDVFERMLVEHTFDFDRQLTGLEIELNLVRSDWEPAFANAEVLEAIADPLYQTELGRYNIELNVPPRALPGDSALELEALLRASLDRADAKAQGGRGRHRHDRHPADAAGRAPAGRVDERQRPLRGDRRGGVRGPARGPGTGHLRGRVPADVLADHRAGVGVHLGAAAPAGLPDRLRRQLECRAAARRPAAGAGRQLAVPVRQAALGGDQDGAVPADHRHPLAGTEEPGRSSSGVLRRTVGDQHLRPVRGERPVLPGAAPGDHRRGAGGGAGRRTGAAAAGVAAAQRDGLPVEPAGVRRRQRAGRTCGWRTGCCRPDPP